MREIKFRVRFDSGIFYYFSMNQQWTDAMRAAHSNAVLNGLHFEQFTGLHDKNGTEIYKGDICSIFLSTGQAVRSVVYFIDGCFIVKFVRPFMDRGVLRKTDYLKCYVANHAVEVIGNIHETPELMEAP